MIERCFTTQYGRTVLNAEEQKLSPFKEEVDSPDSQAKQQRRVQPEGNSGTAEQAPVAANIAASAGISTTALPAARVASGDSTTVDPQPSRPKSSWLTVLIKSPLQILYGTGFLGLLLVGISTFFADQNYYAELLSHFRWQYMCIGLAMLCASPWLANRWFLLLTLILTVPHAIQVLPYSFPPRVNRSATIDSDRDNSPQILADGPAMGAHSTLKLVVFNVFYRSDRYDATIDFIKQHDPDMFILIECSRQWEQAIIDGLGDRYPYNSEQTLPGWRGNQLFSKTPLRAALQVPEYAAVVDAKRLMTVETQWQGQSVYIAAVHPASPDSPEKLELRNEELEVVAHVAANVTAPIVFAGDFNCSSGSPYFTKLIEESGLTDSRYGFGWQGSWPSFAWGMQIPIDHVLLSKHWQVIDRKIGPNLGSDHLPIVIELQLR